MEGYKTILLAALTLVCATWLALELVILSEDWMMVAMACIGGYALKSGAVGIADRKYKGAKK